MRPTLLSLLAVPLLACATAAPAPAHDAADAGPVRALRVPDGGYRPLTDDAPLPTAEDLPGYPVDQVLPSLARQMLAFAQDAFSYDGCATALQQCLRDPVHARHALRMLSLATRLAAAGATNAEIDTALNRYYAGFAAPRARFTVDPGLCQGPDDAPVTLVEFSDFQCPYCRAAAPLLEGLVGSASPARLCFKPFPLKQHPDAVPAAEAALFARAHGKFWPMHDLLFTHQEALDAEHLRGYASELELDPEGLARANQLQLFAGALEASKDEGKRAGVASTPSVYFNGRSFDLPFAAPELRHAVDDELEWTANGGHWAPK